MSLPGSTYEKEDPSQLMTMTLLSENMCFDKPFSFTTTLRRFTVPLLFLLDILRVYFCPTERFAESYVRNFHFTALLSFLRAPRVVIAVLCCFQLSRSRPAKQEWYNIIVKY